MIDIRNRVTGYREFIAGEVLLAAAVVVIGMFSQGDLVSSSFLSKSDGGTAAESPAEGPGQTPGEEAAAGARQSDGSEKPALSTETAAEVEPEESGENSGAQSAAYTKVQEDGQSVSDVVVPDGGRIYSEKELILINPWHLLPEDYEPELENVEYGHKMDVCAAEHLRDMLADCREEGLSPLICSSFRERSKQERLFENDVRKYMYSGMTEEEAREETARNVAVPGSSEHEAGLAVDIVYAGRQILDEEQENNDTQQWLMEHCWEYGFILRYPSDKQEITGITYEPWHYRYVGFEGAEEIMSKGICLEEYLGVIDTD
jgi:D-alanyl-D-alanine carboxypeptidase